MISQEQGRLLKMMESKLERVWRDFDDLGDELSKISVKMAWIANDVMILRNEFHECHKEESRCP